MEVERLVVGPLQVNCYILHDGTTAVVVDPGDEPDRILDRLDELGLDVVRIVLTHAHVDHVLALGPVHEATGAPVELHPADRDLLARAPDHARELVGRRIDPPPEPDHDLTPGSWSAGPVRGEILHTPGHTPGGVTLHLPDQELALVGDVLFAGGVGRTDLGGDRVTLMRSIRDVLLDLPTATRVLPGHGPATTIGREARSNPFLR